MIGNALILNANTLLCWCYTLLKGARKFFTLTLPIHLPPKLFLACALISPHVAATAEEPVKFGCLALDTPSAMHDRLTPLINYLSASLQRPVELILLPDMPSTIQNIATASSDFAYLTPVAYIESRRLGNTRLVVKTQTHSQGSFKLIIVTRQNSPITDIEHLAGTSFAFGDRAALLQRAVVVGAGMPLQKLGRYVFLGHSNNVVRGVMHGDFDAGIVKDTAAYNWQEKGLNIIYASPPLPPFNITASASVDDHLFQKMRQALLHLDTTQPKHREILDSLDKQYDGFIPTSDSEYDVVRELIKPFDQLD